jgi:HlyD family secretion protein
VAWRRPGQLLLAGAVTASGTIVVESAVKKVQHPTGGIVGQLLAMK